MPPNAKNIEKTARKKLYNFPDRGGPYIFSYYLNKREIAICISDIYPIWALALGPMQGVRGAQPPAGVA